MKTIGFFGDSFCAGREQESWCTIIAKRLDAKVVNWGEPGRSIWSTFERFNFRLGKNIVPDYSLFCWTEPYRLYHPQLILSANTEPMEGVDPNVYKALDNYWKYLHSYDKDHMSYEYSLKYYDQNILSQVDKTIVQMWSFRPFETAGKDADIKLQSGIFIDESMYSFMGGAKTWGQGKINHMTVEQNQAWADKIYERIKG